MQNVREGNVRVYYLEKEIRERIEVLSEGHISERRARQILDGEKFLDMIKHTPYKSCGTIVSLKNRISKIRNKKKAELLKLDTGADGHQMTLFELLDERSEQEKAEDEKRIAELKEEIHWLHKCLGICKNKDYFA